MNGGRCDKKVNTSESLEILGGRLSLKFSSKESKHRVYFDEPFFINEIAGDLYPSRENENSPYR